MDNVFRVNESAMVVLSGGQDSTTCLFWAIKNFKEVFTVTFDYGQRHRIEVEAAETVCAMAGIPEANRETIVLGPVLKSASPLLDLSSPLETYSDVLSMGNTIGDRVELTFVPLRNLLFLTLGANRALARGCFNLVTGVCQEDNANYPDCRESFRHRAEMAINFALGFDSARKFAVIAPLIDKTKAMSVHLAASLPGCMDALAFSHTSYSGEYPPVTQDHATVLRAGGFHEAGLPDPLIVRAFAEGLIANLPPTSNYDGVRR